MVAHACCTSPAAFCRSSSAALRPMVPSSSARRTFSHVSARALFALSRAPSDPHPNRLRRAVSCALSP